MACRCGCSRRPRRARNITLVIAERDLETALARVHDRFFGEGVRQ
jgi:hypothetical protein